MRLDLRRTRLAAALAGALALVGVGLCAGFFFADRLRHDLAATSANAAAGKGDPSAPTVTTRRPPRRRLPTRDPPPPPTKQTQFRS